MKTPIKIEQISKGNEFEFVFLYTKAIVSVMAAMSAEVESVVV